MRGLRGGDRGVVDAEPRRRARPHVVDEDVGGRREPQQRLARRRPLQVEHDALLVAVDVEEIGGHARIPRRADAAHHLALGRLDLDDFGAEVAEDLGRHRPQYRDRQVDDANPRKRSRTCHISCIRTFLAMNRHPGEGRCPTVRDHGAPDSVDLRPSRGMTT